MLLNNVAVVFVHVYLVLLQAAKSVDEFPLLFPTPAARIAGTQEAPGPLAESQRRVLKPEPFLLGSSLSGSLTFCLGSGNKVEHHRDTSGYVNGPYQGCDVRAWY